MVVVFGSINLDLIFPVPRIPRPGETVLGPSIRIEPGGKGANQAVAAALDGATVVMAGAVGRDNLATSALVRLREAKVDLSRVIEANATTGCATITVDPEGNNAIAVASGANLAARQTQIEDSLLSDAGVLVLQMEVPGEESSALIRRAKARNTRIILNLAPASALPEAVIRLVDILVVNETESAWLAAHLGCADGASTLRDRLGVIVVRTLGEEGLEVVTSEGTVAMPAHAITARDTTAAGDCFVGVLAAGLDRDLSLHDALRRAMAAAALCCMRAGSQGSLPEGGETDAFLNPRPVTKRASHGTVRSTTTEGETMPMNRQQIDRAARVLVQARREMTPLSGLPDDLKPASFEDAHAIQDAVSNQLGKLIAGFKAMAPADGEPTRGIIYGGTIHASPCKLPASTVPQCGVEGEVAFVFRRDLPSRAKPYTRNEVAAVMDACAVIEVVHSRFARKAPVSNLEKLADSISNGALVYDAPRSDWRGLQLGKLKVTLTVNGKKSLEQVGGHPTGDPLGVAVVLANIWREKGGLRAGQFVTCGSFTGLKFLKPGDTCSARFEGLGSAEVTFTKP